MKKRLVSILIFVPVLCAICLLWANYHCVIYKIKGLPELENAFSNQDIHEIVLLSSRALCGTCPAGNYIYAMSHHRNAIYIVPDDYSTHDIENLRHAFGIRGDIVITEAKYVAAIKRISNCVNDKEKANINRLIIVLTLFG